jgi:hypothetical protein
MTGPSLNSHRTPVRTPVRTPASSDNRKAKRRRENKPLLPSMPWALVGTLGILYVLIGLLLSAPMPPFWVWILALLGTPLLVVGLNRPNTPQVSERFELLAYVGAFLLVVALAVAANFTGSDQSDTPLLVALLSFLLLTLLCVALTAAVAVMSALSGEKLMQMMDYRPSISLLMGTCLVGLAMGALAGLATVVLTTPR